MEGTALFDMLKHIDAPSIAIAVIALYIMNGAWRNTAEQLKGIIAENQRIIERNTAVIFALLSKLDSEKTGKAKEIFYDDLGL